MIITAFFSCQIDDSTQIPIDELVRILEDRMARGDKIQGFADGRIVAVRRNMGSSGTVPIGCDVDIEVENSASIGRHVRQIGDFTVANAGSGRTGYEAYGEAGGWETFDGRAMPSWDELGKTETGRDTRRRWDVAAEAIGQAVRARVLGQIGQYIEEKRRRRGDA